MPRPQSALRPSRLMGVLAALVLTAGTPPEAAVRTTLVAAQDPAPRVNPDAKAIAGFQKEVAEYLDLHRKLASTLPGLAKDASPAAVFEYQQTLGRLIQQARKDEGVGHIFTRDARPVLRRLLYGLFTGPNGKRLRDAVMEENPG